MSSDPHVCYLCGRYLKEHVVYSIPTSVPADAVQGVFDIQVTGFYCPPPRAS